MGLNRKFGSVGKLFGQILMCVAVTSLVGCVPTVEFAENKTVSSTEPDVSTTDPASSQIKLPNVNSCTRSCEIDNGVGTQSCGVASTSPCTVSKCNGGYVPSNGACVPANALTKYVCTSYSRLVLNPTTQELTSVSGKDIPAQDPSGKGRCFYYPIYEGPVLSGLSSQIGTGDQYHDQSVVSRNHDLNSYNSNSVWHPYSTNHTTVKVTLAGTRTIELSGGSSTDSSFTPDLIAIDNFFLIGAYPAVVKLDPNNLLAYYSAWGTEDSTISDANGATNGIAFNPAQLPLTANATHSYPDGSVANYSSVGLVTSSSYKIIPLNVLAGGGTAHVPVVTLTNLIPPQVQTTIDFRGLDCGQSRYMDNVYLLID